MTDDKKIKIRIELRWNERNLGNYKYYKSYYYSHILHNPLEKMKSVNLKPNLKSINYVIHLAEGRWEEGRGNN